MLYEDLEQRGADSNLSSEACLLRCSTVPVLRTCVWYFSGVTLLCEVGKIAAGENKCINTDFIIPGICI
ncbi:hypothetical protein Q5P01_007856 [Channa striata]|uniref:Uncharacterized protein n=1 Tax=Channa striata TaxID=64152 RepID=A0AA88N4C5_CHASR|nr:hypothetical protein Q5P01_007856 [Channa striata]